MSMRSIENYSQRVDRAWEVLEESQAVVIGAGAGFSAAAGLLYGGAKFEEYFADFISKYGFTDLYTSAFYQFESEEERWARWAKHVDFCRHGVGALPLYTQLLDLVGDKEHFVITTNADGQFSKAGFESERIFVVQGDYTYIQCARGCHNTVYDNKQLIERMLPTISDCRISSQLIPLCPKCGGAMDLHLRKDEHFVTTDEWVAQSQRYHNFIERHKDSKVAYLELGVGLSTPTIIRYPFENFVYHSPRATLIRMNRDFSSPIPENVERTISFCEDIESIFSRLG